MQLENWMLAHPWLYRIPLLKYCICSCSLYTLAIHAFVGPLFVCFCFLRCVLFAFLCVFVVFLSVLLLCLFIRVWSSHSMNYIAFWDNPPPCRDNDHQNHYIFSAWVFLLVIDDECIVLSILTFHCYTKTLRISKMDHRNLHITTWYA